MNVEWNLRLRQNIGNFLTSWETISFSELFGSILLQPYPNSSCFRFFMFSTFPNSRTTEKYNHAIDNTAWPYIHVSHVAAQTDAQDSSTVANLHRKIARLYKVDALVSISNLQTGKQCWFTLCPTLRTVLGNVTRLRPLVLLINVVLD